MRGADGDAVEGYTGDDDEPDSVNGGECVFVYFREVAILVHMCVFSIVLVCCAVSVAKELTWKMAMHHHEQMHIPFGYSPTWTNSP